MRYQRKKRCSVLGCGSDCSDPTIKFFHFPRNPDRLKIWKKFCANPAIEHLSHSNLKVHKHVCSRHFNSEEFLIYSRRSLRPIAADPSLKPPGIQLLHSPLVMKMKPGPQNEAIKPIAWLLGTWLSKTGCGSYPNITPFCYNEEITFKSVGQPMMNYSAVTWHPIKQIPMHLETGFLRINPGTKNLALMTAHNFGVSIIEEGIVDEDEKRIFLKSTKIERMSFSKGVAVTKTEREIGICDGKLKQVFKMETEKTPLTVHLVATYDRVSD